MNRTASGHYDTTATGGETVSAFVPFPLPPEPTLDLAGAAPRSRRSRPSISPETGNACWNAPLLPLVGWTA